jgi:hypothetical protein
LKKLRSANRDSDKKANRQDAERAKK